MSAMTSAAAGTVKIREADRIRQRFIEAAGHVTQSMGLGRALGQIYAHIYLNPEPQTLDDLTRELKISKGSASMSVRQLEQWGALRIIWVRGDRKDYYEALEEFGKIIRKAFVELVGRKMEVSNQLFDEVEESFKNGLKSDRKSNGDLEFLRRRIEMIRVFRDRIRKLWDNAFVAFLLK